MQILTVNTGSASVKLALFNMDADSDRARHSAKLEQPAAPAELIATFMREAGTDTPPDAVAHRVVHGGDDLVDPRPVDAGVERQIERLAVLAPLHNPVALRWIRACRDHFGDRVPQVAVFDTAFYARLPDVARTYALPADLERRLGVRRYGFHGLAHRALWERWCTLRPEIPGGGRLISLQLGGGCSITASEKGIARDTSMGFSPAEGLVMATRSGDLDPGALTYIMRQDGLDPDAADELVNQRSGLLGVSGKSADMRMLLDDPDARSRLAIELYCYRARKYLGAYLAVLGGADGIVFGGGVGENVPEVRHRILKDLKWAGIIIDATANAAVCDGATRISTPGSQTDVWVVPADEAPVLAAEAQAVVENAGNLES